MQIKGIAASAGIAIGKAFLLDTEDFSIPQRQLNDSEVPREIARFEDALMDTRSQILEIQDKIAEDMGVEHAEIFNAHLLVLEDRTIIEEVLTGIKKRKLNVEYIFLEVLRKYIRAFSRMEDEYLKERVSDVEDVGKRILRNLLGKKRETLNDLKERVIVVAYDLAPSDTATMHKKNVIAFVTDIGGKTSHTAIMAKSLEIPAVVGLEVITQKVKNGDLLIVDGVNGMVEINPTEEVIAHYELEKTKYEDFDKELYKLKDLSCETPDGHVVELAANIELPEELGHIIAHGANGIGLYRTEYFYMNRKGLPSEDEHFEAYKYVAEQIAPFPVVIRTLDLGGDKFLSQLEIPHEMNPFLGWRAIRLSLARPDIFKVQLRAILRASAFGKIKLMYPMISGVEEVRQANAILEEAKNELRQKNIPFDEDIDVGAMIEIPSAALTCDILAKEVDFFSIGTNDLIQYSLAVDRVNEKIAYLYEPTHPAILRLIKGIIDVGHENSVWVGMCGEMASEPHFALLLLGMGLDEFSVSPMAILTIKKIIRSVSYADAKKITEEAMKLSTGKEVEDFANRKLREILQSFIA